MKIMYPFLACPFQPHVQPMVLLNISLLDLCTSQSSLLCNILNWQLTLPFLGSNVFPGAFSSNMSTCYSLQARSCDSSVIIVTRLWAGWGSRIWFPIGEEIFPFSTESRPALGPNLSPWVPGALSPEVKCLGHKVDHSPPTNVKIKNIWSCTSTLPYIFMAWCSIKHMDNLNCFIAVSQSNRLCCTPT
jgi:hypothetical protein